MIYFDKNRYIRSNGWKPNSYEIDFDRLFQDIEWLIDSKIEEHDKRLTGAFEATLNGELIRDGELKRTVVKALQEAIEGIKV